MAITIVQTDGNASNDFIPSISVTLENVTAGNVIVVLVGLRRGGGSNPVLTVDDTVNTYTQRAYITSGGLAITGGIFTAVAATSATLTITFSFTEGDTYCVITAMELAGVNTSASVLSNTNLDETNPASTTVTAGNITSSVNGSIYCATMFTYNNVTTTPENGGIWTEFYDTDAIQGGRSLSSMYYIQPSAGALNPQWTLSGAPDGWAACVIALEPSVGGGGGSTIRLLSFGSANRFLTNQMKIISQKF